ncbi:MAG: c-type cytochrome [Solirubrobacteraceae bacterium]
MLNTAKTLPARRSILAPAAVAALAAAALLSGCGGGRTTAQRATTDGRAVFAASCSACHSLDGRYHAGLIGGDLRRLHATREQLTQFAAEMPVRHPLSGAQLRAVVRYVLDVERGAR